VPEAGIDASLAVALAALPSLCLDGARYEGHLPPDCDEPLRRLAVACVAGRTMVFVFAERAPSKATEPYQRLWDRTDDFAEAVAAWKTAAGTFPDLRPGDIVRL
jgi:hypothetical protein